MLTLPGIYMCVYIIEQTFDFGFAGDGCVWNKSCLKKRQRFKDYRRLMDVCGCFFHLVYVCHLIPPRTTLFPRNRRMGAIKPLFPACKTCAIINIKLKFLVPRSRGCGSKAVGTYCFNIIACWQVTEDEEENTVSMSFDGSSEAEGLIKITSPSDPRVVLFFRQVNE